MRSLLRLGAKRAPSSDNRYLCISQGFRVRKKPDVHAAAKRPRLGFTLVEVMISLFLVAAGAMMFYALMPMAFKSGKMVGNYQQASSLVQHKIDQLRGVGYGRLTYAELRNAGIIDASPSTPPYQFKTVDGLATIYPNPTATIDVIDFSVSIKRVTVTLTWTGSANKQGNGAISAVALVSKS